MLEVIGFSFLPDLASFAIAFHQVISKKHFGDFYGFSTIGFPVLSDKVEEA